MQDSRMDVCTHVGLTAPLQPLGKGPGGERPARVLQQRSVCRQSRSLQRRAVLHAKSVPAQGEGIPRQLLPLAEPTASPSPTPRQGANSTRVGRGTPGTARAASALALRAPRKQSRVIGRRREGIGRRGWEGKGLQDTQPGATVQASKKRGAKRGKQAQQRGKVLGRCRACPRLCCSQRKSENRISEKGKQQPLL